MQNSLIVQRANLEAQKKKLETELKEIEKKIKKKQMEEQKKKLLMGEKDIVGKWFKQTSNFCEVVLYLYCNKKKKDKYHFYAAEMTPEIDSFNGGWEAVICGENHATEGRVFQFHPASWHPVEEIAEKYEQVSELEIPLLLGVSPRQLLEMMTKKGADSTIGYQFINQQFQRITKVIIGVGDLTALDPWE